MNGIKALQIQRIEKEMRMRLAVTIQKCNTLRGLLNQYEVILYSEVVKQILKTLKL